MADPIVTYGGREGDQLAAWNEREQRRLQVLRNAYDQRLKDTLHNQRRLRDEEEREREWRERQGSTLTGTSLPATLRSMSGVGSSAAHPLSLSAGENPLVAARARKNAEIKAFEAWAHKQQAREATAEQRRAEKLALKTGAAREASVQLERVRKCHAEIMAGLENSREEVQEAEAAAARRLAAAEKEKQAQIKERSAAWVERRNDNLKRLEHQLKDKTERYEETLRERHERFQAKRRAIEDQKELEKKSMLESLAKKKREVQKELERRMAREDAIQAERAARLEAKQAHAQKQLKRVREQQEARVRSKDEYKAFMADNIAISNQEYDAKLQLAAARVKRSITVGEELERRKDTLAKQARELHFKQSELRKSLKDMAWTNETTLIQQGPNESLASVPEPKAGKIPLLKPMQPIPKPQTPEKPRRLKFIKGRPNPYTLSQEDYQRYLQ